MLQEVKRWAVCLGVLSVLVVGASRPAAATDGVLAGGGTLGNSARRGPFQISIRQQGAAVEGGGAAQMPESSQGGWIEWSFQATGGDIATTVTGYLELRDSSGSYTGPGALSISWEPTFPKGIITVIVGDPIDRTITRPVYQGQITLQTR
jgi:hypothetical protein